MRYSELVKDTEFKLVVNFISKKWIANFDKNVKMDIGNTKVEVDSFKKALQNYYWPYKINQPLPVGFDYCGNSYESSAKILHLASEKLGSEKDFFQGAKIVLEWGGVVNKNLKRIANWKYPEFKNEVRTAQQNWDGFLNNQIELGVGNIDFHINSGFSKIYSLMLKDFIIYDSRTAAALTAIINEVLGKAPNNWTLRVPSPRVNIEKRVPPKFDRVNTLRQYWTSNLIASILVQEVCKKINVKKENVSTRDVEAALFMLGADIRQLKGIIKKK
jgi:hypothetical protein